MHRPHDRFLELNLTDKEAVAIIAEHISSRTPFAFTRIGDGDIHILHRHLYNKHIRKCLQNNWGINEKDLGAAFDDFFILYTQAIAESDMIGLLDQNNPMGMRCKKTWSIPTWILEKMKIRESQLSIADHHLTRKQQLGNPRNLKNLIDGCPIHIVTCHAKRLKENCLSDLLETDVGYTNIPMSAKFKDRRSILNSLSIKEPVVLFGCGGGLKDIGIHLKKKGKVALDFGATLCAWAGIISRQWFHSGSYQRHCFIKHKGAKVE